jgi:hypothetical protein
MCRALIMYDIILSEPNYKKGYTDPGYGRQSSRIKKEKNNNKKLITSGYP